MNYDEYSRANVPEQAVEPGCPRCGSSKVRTTFNQEPFTYGQGTDAVVLSTTIPVRTCVECDFQFTDAGAEDAQHEAVCRHLGVMLPGEILGLRRRHVLSRSSFSQITKLGEATLARWERGELIQNAAYDQFLYLLTFQENLDRLKSRNEGVSEKRLASNHPVSCTFRLLQVDDADREAASAFELRRYKKGA